MSADPAWKHNAETTARLKRESLQAGRCLDNMYCQCKGLYVSKGVCSCPCHRFGEDLL